MPKFLIITADDFGLEDTVNEAVEQATRRGVLTAASLMVGARGTEDAIRRAKLLPGLRVGLHLVLVDGKALLPHEKLPDLTDDSGYMGNKMLYRSIRAFALPRVRRQFEVEIRAQFEKFAGTGLLLDHVNLHKHFHLHPTILDLVLRIGRDYGLTAMRLPSEPLWFAHERKKMAPAVGNLFLHPWIRLLEHRLSRARVFYNDTLFGIAQSGAMDEALLTRVIERLPDGVNEIYMHPAATTAPLSASMLGYRHSDELAALLSDRVRSAIASRGVALGGFTDALACRPGR